MSALSSNLKLKCYLCDEKPDDWPAIRKHLIEEHQLKDGSSLSCVKLFGPEIRCDTKFCSFRALRAHLGKNCVIVSTGTPESTSAPLACNIYADLENSLQVYINNIMSKNLSHDTTSMLIIGTFDIIASLMNTIEKRIEQNKCDCKHVMNGISTILRAQISEYSTKYKRSQNMLSESIYVPPETIEIDQRSSLQFVPISKSLKALFSNDDYKNTYFEFNSNGRHTCFPGRYEDFCCGSKYKEIEACQINSTIQIQLYIDDFEMCSPIGSKTRKICAVYFTVRNIPLELRSRLNFIYLVALAESNAIKSNGINCVMRPIVDDLKQLEDTGIYVDNQWIKGVLINISFDNAAGNVLFGMIQSFNANHYCRICKATIQEADQNFEENKTLLRTREEYDHIFVDREQERNELGYRCYSILNELKFFNTIECRSQDILHDVLEGVVRYTLCDVFHFWNEKKIFNFDTIGRKIAEYTYGSLENSNKPSPISVAHLKSRNLRQNASQMRCLMLNLPFIFGEELLPKITENREVKQVWKCIRYLLRIMQIVWSTVIEEEYLHQLEDTVRQFLKTYKKLFPGKRIKPKFHFMTHYANTIRATGPLKHMSTMRGEANHKKIKEFGKNARNYRNITLTLAERHQADLYMKLKGDENLCAINMIQPLAHTKFSGNVDLPTEWDIDCDVISTKCVYFNGYEYRPGSFIVDAGIARKISEIITRKSTNKYYLICENYNIDSFDSFSNSIKITKDSNSVSEIIEFKCLTSNKPHNSKILNNEIYIIAATLDIQFP